MQERFGDADDLVVQLKQEVFALEKKTRTDLAAKNLGRRALDQVAAADSSH